MHTCRRIIALSLLIAYLPACSSYRPSALAPSEAVAGRDEVEVLVGQGSGTESIRLRDPWVRNDSIGGERRACTPRRNRSEPWQCEYVAWALPLTEINAVKTRQFDAGKVVVLTMLIAAPIAVMALTYDMGPVLSSPSR
jgi:hypothetical protein